MGNKHMQSQMRKQKELKSSNTKSFFNPRKSEENTPQNQRKLSFENFKDCGKMTQHSKESNARNLNSKTLTDKIGHTYSFVSLIDAGTSSKVYLVKRTKDGRKFAVKVIDKRQAIIKKAVGNLKNELINLRSVDNSPFLISLISATQTQSELFFIFPYYQQDLFNVLRRNICLDEQATQFIMAQVYIALTTLHRKKILFRDLKPENIVVDVKTGYICLVDFGLSLPGVQEDSKIKTLCGTNEYIPPEIIVNQDEGYNFDFDWWCFGILMYELLFGRPPFRGESQKEIFDNILSNEIKFGERADLSDEGKDLILYLLHKDKDRRIFPEQIPFHPFFKNLNFRNVENFKFSSPLKKLINKNGTFHKDFVMNDSDTHVKEIEIDQSLFSEF